MSQFSKRADDGASHWNMWILWQILQDSHVTKTYYWEQLMMTTFLPVLVQMLWYVWSG